MYLSLNWLKDFVDIPKKVTPEELGKLLTLHTVEVEKVERQADKYKNVIVGKILEVRPHPNADRLRLAKVDVGPSAGSPRPELGTKAGQFLEIVCGAPNIEPGQLVPVALVGANLPGGLEIKPAEIRGVKSNGMLCAPDELGLGGDHAGIMILNGKSPLPPFFKGGRIGQPFADFLGLNDVVFEVDNKSITHRADLWSHYGMARDISAFLDAKFRPVKISPHKPPFNPPFKRGAGGFKINAKVDDFKLCPRYMAVGMSGIKIESSPEWLSRRLLAAGMRPINNIVDATNYVMLELGQPLHAFDKNFLDKIIVRRAKAGETMETLDGVKRKLEPDMLVIADSAKPVAVAGVMGGANSEINPQTTQIILEAANFNFDSVRKTAQKLGLRTEASMRFEKGLDPNLAELGLWRVVELIKKICPSANVSSNLVDEKKYKLNQGPINFSLDWLNNRIGEKFSAKEARRILEKLGFKIEEKNSALNVTIPSWRAVRDISLPEDIVEEVARIYGYNNINPVMPEVKIAAPFLNPEINLQRKIKNILSLGAKMTEVYNYSFIKSGGELKLANPLSEDLAYLRPSLVPGLLENVKANQAVEETIALYEIGSIFLNKPGENDLPFQEKRLGLVLAAGDDENLYRKLKGIVEFLFESLNLPVAFEPVDSGADILAQGRTIGRISQPEKTDLRAIGIKKSTVTAEISFTELFNALENAPAKTYEEAAKFPPAVRDLAFVVNEKILYNNIVKLLLNFSGLIKKVELFDVFAGEKLGEGKKSLAFHIIYQSDKTLTNQEVDEAQEKLIKHLEKEIGAKIRNF